MSEAVLIAGIPVVVGGLFTLIYKLIDRKAEDAKSEREQIAGEVETVNRALIGLQILADERLAELNHKNTEIDRLRKDLVEEKAVTVALSKQIDTLREGRPNG